MVTVDLRYERVRAERQGPRPKSDGFHGRPSILSGSIVARVKAGRQGSRPKPESTGLLPRLLVDRSSARQRPCPVLSRPTCEIEAPRATEVPRQRESTAKKTIQVADPGGLESTTAREERREREHGKEDDPVGLESTTAIDVPRAREHDEEDKPVGGGGKHDHTTAREEPRAREHGEEDKPVGGGGGESTTARKEPRDREHGEEDDSTIQGRRSQKTTIQGVGEEEKKFVRNVAVNQDPEEIVLANWAYEYFKNGELDKLVNNEDHHQGFHGQLHRVYRATDDNQIGQLIIAIGDYSRTYRAGGGGGSKSEIGPLDWKRINDALDKHLEKASPSTSWRLNGKDKLAMAAHKATSSATGLAISLLVCGWIRSLLELLQVPLVMMTYLSKSCSILPKRNFPFLICENSVSDWNQKRNRDGTRSVSENVVADTIRNGKWIPFLIRDGIETENIRF
ncbi:hypothetical protein Syun_013867 [Stephania yunnanensis]|uniref:Uncharacterized protein n=1 Tax=Stephania yunnanensis TaxID=152371 RepID=A0AAP0JKH2_9MAGN